MSGPRPPETSCPIVCMKRAIYDEFSAALLQKFVPDNRIPKDDNGCAVTVYKGKTHGDGIIGVREVGNGAKALIKETGEVYTGLTADEWKSFNLNGVFPPTAKLNFKVDQDIASRFIVAMFGPEELSALTVQKMCSPLSNCHRRSVRRSKNKPLKTTS